MFDIWTGDHCARVSELCRVVVGDCHCRGRYDWLGLGLARAITKIEKYLASAPAQHDIFVSQY